MCGYIGNICVCVYGDRKGDKDRESGGKRGKEREREREGRERGGIGKEGGGYLL